MLRQLPNVFIMNKAWSEKHNVAKPQDFVNKEETYAARNTNGTGAYKLKSREVDVRTVFVENTEWWNKDRKIGNVTEVVFTPIKQNATRTAALLSGEIDFVLDPAAQDLERLRQQAKVVEGNEYRTIYLGFDQKRPELLYSSVKGKNPFADVRVREALYRAIDVEAIKRAVMRGLSAPTGTMIAPQVHGWTEALHKRVPYDPEKSRALLKEAGYDGTLSFTLDCPNNRYINDEAICQAVVGMWAKVGVKASLNAMPRATYFPKVQSRDTSAFPVRLGRADFRRHVYAAEPGAHQGRRRRRHVQPGRLQQQGSRRDHRPHQDRDRPGQARRRHRPRARNPCPGVRPYPAARPGHSLGHAQERVGDPSGR